MMGALSVWRALNPGFRVDSRDALRVSNFFEGRTTPSSWQYVPIDRLHKTLACRVGLRQRSHSPKLYPPVLSPFPFLFFPFSSKAPFLIVKTRSTSRTS